MKKIFIYLILPFVFLLNSCGSAMISKFEIETKEGIKEPINILREDYDLMISEKSSFILYIASSTCSSCKKFSTTVLNPYIENTGAVIYRIETYHIDDVINYYATPAISVIKKGEVVNTINMAKNEKHFKSEESLKKYIERYVTYGSSQK